MWSKLSTSTKIVLAAQGLALLYAIHKRSHVTSVVAGMTLAGVILGELQAQRVAKVQAASGAGNTTTISSLADLKLVK